MKTFLSTLAITLAITFMATPADALDDLAKCRVYNAKIKMNYAKCLELDELLVAKGKAPKGNCDSKRTASLEKATAKFVTKLDVNDFACGIDTETAAGDQALQWLASGDGSLTPEQEAALAGTQAVIPLYTALAIAAAAEQDGCEAANGTWGGDLVCTPAATTPPQHDCFSAGACGVDGWNLGDLQGGTISSTGCADTAAQSLQYRWGSYGPTVSFVYGFPTNFLCQVYPY